MAVDFDWQPNTWYTLKFTVEQKEKTALVRGKVWKKGEAEPEKWTIEFEDPNPNRDGAAALYGYIPNVLGSGRGGRARLGNLLRQPEHHPQRRSDTAFFVGGQFSQSHHLL